MTSLCKGMTLAFLTVQLALLVSLAPCGAHSRLRVSTPLAWFALQERARRVVASEVWMTSRVGAAHSGGHFIGIETEVFFNLEKLNPVYGILAKGFEMGRV